MSHVSNATSSTGTASTGGTTRQSSTRVGTAEAALTPTTSAAPPNSAARVPQDHRLMSPGRDEPAKRLRGPGSGARRRPFGRTGGDVIE
ncbi:hypothetical protein GCM10027184_45470 [Saccharothrix stipae]